MTDHAVFAQTPPPPYYAVIFTSTRAPAAPQGEPGAARQPGGARNDRDDGDDGYADTAQRMVELAAGMPGYLGVESVRDHGSAGAPGITVSYWSSLEAIAAWRSHAEHAQARARGRTAWYQGYQVRICKVERAYGFASG